jgi:hypothetical protein
MIASSMSSRTSARHRPALLAVGADPVALHALKGLYPTFATGKALDPLECPRARSRNRPMLGEGFEPSVARKGDDGFRDRHLDRSGDDSGTKLDDLAFPAGAEPAPAFH